MWFCPVYLVQQFGFGTNRNHACGSQVPDFVLGRKHYKRPTDGANYPWLASQCLSSFRMIPWGRNRCAFAAHCCSYIFLGQENYICLHSEKVHSY